MWRLPLERIYKPGQGEITFKLKAMAACFLETDMKGREEVFQDVGEFYRMRSKIVHGEKLSAEAKNETFTKGFEVARRSVVKLLQDGPPSAWHKVVIAGTEPSAPKP